MDVGRRSIASRLGAQPLRSIANINNIVNTKEYKSFLAPTGGELNFNSNFSQVALATILSKPQVTTLALKEAPIKMPIPLAEKHPKVVLTVDSIIFATPTLPISCISSVDIIRGYSNAPGQFIEKNLNIDEQQQRINLQEKNYVQQEQHQAVRTFKRTNESAGKICMQINSNMCFCKLTFCWCNIEQCLLK